MTPEERAARLTDNPAFDPHSLGYFIISAEDLLTHERAIAAAIREAVEEAKPPNRRPAMTPDQEAAINAAAEALAAVPEPHRETLRACIEALLDAETEACAAFCEARRHETTDPDVAAWLARQIRQRAVARRGASPDAAP